MPRPTPWYRRFLWGGGLLALALLLSGCVERVDWDTLQWQGPFPAGDLYHTRRLAQEIVPQRDGLCAVEVQLLDRPGSGRPAVPLLVQLCRDRACTDVVATATVPTETLSTQSTFALRFPPERASAGQTYWLVASAPAAEVPAQATLRADTVDRYPPGQLWRDGQPAGGDLAFRTYYSVGASDLLRELVQGAARSLRFLPALFLTFLAPGLLIVRLLPPEDRDDPLERWALSLGLSVAFWPVVLLLLSQTRIRWNALEARIAGRLLLAVALALEVRDRVRAPRKRTAQPPWAALTLGGLAGLGLLLRALQAADLPAPLWMDAIHHALLARLIVEKGGIPVDYTPYIQAPATYHFGFQSLVALLHVWSEEPFPRALLIVGQTLSALAGITLYPWGKRLGGSAWAGVAAAAVPTAFTWMPSYALSWSRYTLVGGLFLLPIGAHLLQRWLERRPLQGGLGLVTTIAAAGLLVTHLRIAAFFALWAVLFLLATLVGRRYSAQEMARPLLRALLAAAGAVVLTAPWLLRSVRLLWLPAAREWPTSVDGLSFYYITAGAGIWVARVAPCGIGAGLLLRRRAAILLLAWSALLFLLATGAMPGLSQGGLVDSLSVNVALYVPLALGVALAAGAAAQFVQRIPVWGKGWLRPAAAVALIGLSLWGARSLRQVVNPQTGLLSHADLEAIAWIGSHTPPDAVFLIQSYEWMPHVFAGSDGGYWIEPLTGRRTWPPPALYGLGESSEVAHINEVARTAAESRGEALHTLLRQEGIAYVYLGRYGGSLTPEKLCRPYFRPAYVRDGVWVFAVEP
ncbi:MAG: DUF6541 family protein [Chloroflexia bacterium]